MLNTELKIENMLTDINEELIADNIAKNSQMTLDKIPISPSEKTEFNKDNTDVVAPQKQTEVISKKSYFNDWYFRNKMECRSRLS